MALCLSLESLKKLNFEIILDLEESCKNSPEFLYISIQLPVAFSKVNTLHNQGAVTKTKKSTLV